jgi:hypothetical protein
VKEEIINFSDFMKNKNSKNSSDDHKEIIDSHISDVSNLKENIVEDTVEEDIEMEVKLEEVNNDIIVNENYLPEEKIEEKVEEKRYKLYKDKSEVFSCDIEVEGANIKDSQVRIVVESNEWSLLFNGNIDDNGKVNIPIKKLSLLEEGATGKIRMEVIADGTIFVPWDDDFIVKLSKKVMVKFDESKNNIIREKKPNIKVNFR